MMSRKSFVIIGLLVLAIAGNFACANADARGLRPRATATGSAARIDKPDGEGSVARNDQAAVVDGNSQFAVDLYAKLRTTEGNIFFSPYSISTALAMTYAGARGDTEKQMAETMRFALAQKKLHPAFGALIADLNSRSGKGHEILVANALWGQQGYAFLKPFLDLTRTHYDSGLNEVNFVGATEAARKKINTWVENKTRHKIKELIKPGILDTLTRLVLTNAIYFKGNWASQFQESRTADAPFTLVTGEKIKAPMMSQAGEFRYYEEKDFQALEMPYEGDDMAMTIFLPKKADGLAALEETLTTAKLEQCLSNLRKVKIMILFPKFTMTSQFSLGDVLKAMGMPDAFSAKADFSGMNGKKDLFISAVLHKAFVEVNEEGTEAAAATAVVISLRSVGVQRPLLFKADHPFFFVIRDTQKKSVLFMGRVMNPAS